MNNFCDISEDTRIKSGQITMPNGVKRQYTMIINPAKSSWGTTEYAVNDVSLIVHSRMGRVVDTFQRSYCRQDYPYLTEVIAAALDEFKTEVA